MNQQGLLVGCVQLMEQTADNHFRLWCVVGQWWARWLTVLSQKKSTTLPVCCSGVPPHRHPSRKDCVREHREVMTVHTGQPCFDMAPHKETTSAEVEPSCRSCNVSHPTTIKDNQSMRRARLASFVFAQAADDTVSPDTA